MTTQPRPAHSFQIGICDDPECFAVHFHLFDEHDRMIGMFAIGEQSFDGVIEVINAQKYKINLMKG